MADDLLETSALVKRHVTEIDSEELTPDQFNSAMRATREHLLRAYDAVQLAIALEVQRLQAGGL